ncbi:MAG TPA: hypothetical protein VFY71_10840 [Planctomycetota bacterium]|nr:hypothetical protein [Planctomycetota bacterium]
MKGLLRATSLGCLLACFATHATAQDESTARPGPAQAGSAVQRAQHELADLRELLFQWVSRSDWPAGIGVAKDHHPLSEALDADPCPEISSRLALFRVRYGMNFRDVPGWDDFAAFAGRTYDRLVEEYCPPAPGSSRYGYRWCAPAWTSVRALLLDIAGRSDQARTVLFGDSERAWDGCCMSDLSEDLFYLARARADQLDRAGDSAGALRWLHEAYYRWGQDTWADLFGRPRIASDLVLARYAILLADSSELEAAHAVYRMLEAKGDSLGLSVARTVLGDRLSRAVTSTKSVFGVPIPVTGDEVLAGSTAFVVGDVRDAPTWRVLACSIPKFPERKATNRMAPDCDTDLDVVSPTDPRAVAIVRSCLGQH